MFLFVCFLFLFLSCPGARPRLPSNKPNTPLQRAHSGTIHQSEPHGDYNITLERERELMGVKQMYQPSTNPRVKPVRRGPRKGYLGGKAVVRASRGPKRRVRT